MEKILKVRMLNGAPVAKDTVLEKSDFKMGDEVVIRFQNKDFCGIVDFSRCEDLLQERDGSPRSTNKPGKWPLSRKSHCSLHDHLGGL